MKKYRRVEINAYRRRVSIVSGEWPCEIIDKAPGETTDEVSLNDSDASEPVEPDSPEGQLILVDAVRSLERRLLPEARATIWIGEDKLVPNRSTLKRFYCWLRSFIRKTWTYHATKIPR
ncbi:MAG TPA: hypothetical protein VIV66_20750 [Pyrinomonadaceae bacterium]